MVRKTQSGSRNIFFSAPGRLKPSNAAVGILVRDDGRYVMQLRDNIPGIFYPNHWGCFGGAIDAGESSVQAVRRELWEELEFKVGKAREFTRFQFDLTPIGAGKVLRIYYEVRVSRKAYDRFVLHEGAAVKAFTSRHLLCAETVTPYDAFAIWLHCKQADIRC